MFTRTDAFRFESAAKPYLKIETATLGARGLKLSRVTSTGHEIELTEHDHLTLLLPTHGTLDVAAGTREFHATAGQSLVFRPNSRRTRVRRAPAHAYVALVLQVPVGALECDDADEDKVHLTKLVGNGVLVGGSFDIVHSLRNYLEFLAGDLSQETPFLRSAKAIQAAELLALEQFTTYLKVLHEDTAACAAIPASKVREAEEFMRANYAEPLRISDIARAVGVGTRTLQAAFRRKRETTLLGSLVSIRLEMAHEAICRAGEGQNVTRIALACGFTHLGRFSQLYRQTYGELPSETLRKSR